MEGECKYMKECKCGFSYKDKNDLEMVNLIATEGIVKYYCPDCKEYKFTEKFAKEMSNPKAIKFSEDEIEFVNTINGKEVRQGSYEEYIELEKASSNSRFYTINEKGERIYEK